MSTYNRENLKAFYENDDLSRFKNEIELEEYRKNKRSLRYPVANFIHPIMSNLKYTKYLEIYEHTHKKSEQLP